MEVIGTRRQDPMALALSPERKGSVAVALRNAPKPYATGAAAPAERPERAERAMPVWVNEFHYDNTGADTGEFIELAGTAGTDLTGWSLVLYNGNPTQLVSYNTLPLSGVIANQQNGFGALSFAYPSNGIQNGGSGTSAEPDGIALVDASGAVVQFLSYEGSFNPTNGPAAGLVSADIGIAQSGTEPVGASLHLVGTGDDYADFTWAATTTGSAGAPNDGQTLGSITGETVSINDASVTEGDSGTTVLTFTVTRSGNSGAFSLDFATADGSATLADGDYLAASGTLTFIAGGALSETISVIVKGDTVPEPNEFVTVTLSNPENAAGTTVLADAVGTGTILNDDVELTPIWAIQGAGHKAPSVGGPVGSFGNSGDARFDVEGVVTAVTTNGFWMQDPTGDGDIATSDAIFVFTSSAPAATIETGETVRVLNAQVNEFRPGGSGGSGNLTVTQLTATSGVGASIQELGGVTEIAPVVLGTDRVLPTGTIEDDGFASFDPATDAIDFWESLEGMLVEIPASVAVSPTSAFRTRDPLDSANAEGAPNEEIWVRIPDNTDMSSLTPNGGVILGPTDANPERIQIDDLTPIVDLPDVNVGDALAPVTGVVNYDFGNYEVLVGSAPTVTSPAAIAPETTTLARDARQVTIATYNVENLDPEVENTAAWGAGGVAADGTGGVTGSSSGNASGDLYTRLGNADDDIGSGKYARHAEQIVMNLGAPTILALQEVQDNDGAEISEVVDATQTLQALVDLIQATYGITYAFAFENPPGVNQDGGQPNANIRNAFLYRPDQVTLKETVRLTDPDPGEADGFAGDDFAASRKPLVGIFEADGVELMIVNNHFNSKGGDDDLFGNVQPPVLSSELQRVEQARIVGDYVQGLLDTDPDARVLVLGDLNDFAWSNPLQTLMGTGSEQVLYDLAEELLPAEGRYSYNFEGNAQALDHTLVTGSLLEDAVAGFDIVHVNSEFSDQASDHDPSVTLLDLHAFGERLVLTRGADAVNGEGGNDRIKGRAGDDTIAGGTGDDTLVGGEGADLFVFVPGDGVDKIARFEPGSDRLDLTAFAAAGVHGIEDLEFRVGPYGVTRITTDADPDFRIRVRLEGAELTEGDFLFA